MRKYLLSFLLSMSCFYAKAEKDIRDGTHIFNYPIALNPTNLDGSAIAGAVSENIPANTRFMVRITIGANYIIEIPKFTSNNAAALALNAKLVGPAGSAKYFILAISDYTLNAERYEKRGKLTVGASTTLIKIRPGRKEPKDGYNIYSEFGNDFNIGVSAGWKFQPYRREQLYHNIVGGLSFTNIKVTPYTTKKFVTSESNQGCVTFSLGYVFEYNKFQVSLFSGLDVMSGEVGRNWIYRKRPWIGLGFGFQIFRGQGEAGN